MNRVFLLFLVPSIALNLDILARRTVIISGIGSLGTLFTTPAKAEQAAEQTMIDLPRYLDENIDMQFSDLPRSTGLLVRRYTGENTPFTFNKKAVKLQGRFARLPFERALNPTDMGRADEHKDIEFYTVPRFVYHIDEGAVSALTNYYKSAIPKGSSVLDICSSWVSHYPGGEDFKTEMARVEGYGINPLELRANNQLTGWKNGDLNPTDKITGADAPIIFPYDSGSFDVVTCVVSVDYLKRPVEVMREINRVLKPGGKVIFSQSNRFFPSKVVNIWLNLTDEQRLELIEGYLTWAGGFGKIDCWDITPGGGRDPMWIVEARKEKGDDRPRTSL